MDPLLLAGFAVALALVIAVLMFLSKPKAFLNKTRQSLKIAKIVEVRDPFPSCARARARARDPECLPTPDIPL